MVSLIGAVVFVGIVDTSNLQICFYTQSNIYYEVSISFLLCINLSFINPLAATTYLKQFSNIA